MANFRKWSLALFAASVLIVGAATVSQTACIHTAVHPGAANTFDSTTYDTLIAIQAGIEQAKVGIPDSKKDLLNKVIADYNTAMHAYQVYHSAALAGTATPADQTALQSQVTALQTNLGTLGAKP